MKFGTKAALSMAVVAGLAIVGPALSSNRASFTRSPDALTQSHMVRGSIIKVHTDHGVITLPGTADTWDAAENAVFVADSIADMQMVNNEVPWRIAYE
jgi:BON domain-containing protein